MRVMPTAATSSTATTATSTISMSQTSISTTGQRSRTSPTFSMRRLRTELPFGRGQRFLGNTNRLVDAVLGGWEYSAFLHIRSGTRFDVTDNDTTSLNNGQTNRPDRVGNGQLSHPTVSKWFDTSAFIVHTTPMTYGTCGSESAARRWRAATRFLALQDVSYHRAAGAPVPSGRVSTPSTIRISPRRIPSSVTPRRDRFSPPR